MRRRRSLRIYSRVSTQNYLRGYHASFASGYLAGKQAAAASFHQPFEGTSIIIPTFNQLKYLRSCIESIKKYTQQPYELIIIDNGSKDGTAAYLKSLKGRVRYKIFKVNLGFAGGVNQGLMMAKGTSIVILNNDTLLTKDWLSNLLTCLSSDPSIGLVGPVTNNLSNDQKIAVNYKTTREMQRFASSYNRSNPERWRRSKVIFGFCLLLRRDVLKRVGYLDEGYVNGTCEDVDYYLRIRLLGLDLVIAEDTFIHHYGSVTMRSFRDASRHNHVYFREKWGDWQQIGRLETVMDSAQPDENRKASDFYPTHILVKGTDSNVYWVEHGIRFAVRGGEPAGPAVRLPQLDLWNWPIGADISAESLLRKIAALSTPIPDLTEGGLAQTEDGEMYQYRLGKLHRIVTKQACTAWNFQQRYIKPISHDEKNRYAEGLPIIAPPIVKAGNI
ncbi:glycosyltransferase family 2 protein [Paenibacillus prosopidis]|uniref:GT2 family glycosyltransferase n=1 Tax=Paenibacillus prosopidis TaxID=630520 RepID=A0A368VTV2_9BACL|nr:glycosyltransferase family 2 protein [Paenibacillus prosopidis]RCW43406.1 GT2 family glycosyltransferase [Paenibacillus prosopidis]